MTTRTDKIVLTNAKLYRSHYDIKRRERELLRKVWSELPVDQLAVLTPKQACEYLGNDVNRMTLQRWHARGVLVGIVNEKTNHKKYLMGHLWVFKMLWLQKPEAKAKPDGG